MSELKAFDITVAEEGCYVGFVKYRRHVYDKSEADKVIAHQKYRRCLAMAKWCTDRIDTIKNGYMVSSIHTQYGVMTTCPPECNPKFSFYSRWHERWLELAEKFKEVE
jgi:hypothetical protein